MDYQGFIIFILFPESIIRSRCLEYMRHFGGPNAARLPDTARVSTVHDISEAFHMVDSKRKGFLDANGELSEISSQLS